MPSILNILQIFIHFLNQLRNKYCNKQSDKLWKYDSCYDSNLEGHIICLLSNELLIFAHKKKKRIQ